MSDRGHELTEELLEELEEEIKGEYEKAVKDVEKKLQDYLEKTEKSRLEQKALLDAGEITQKQYNDWVYRHTMVGKRWEDMRDALAKDMVHADAIAQGLIRGKMPDVYALNMNFATFQIEHDGKIDTGFTLYNRDSAQYLLGDQWELMPGPSAKKSAEIRANKDMQWNSRHIQSAVLQGILQGESPYDVAARLRQVGQMDASASIRYARTMTTSAQNAGRYQAFRRARALGVELTIEWQATLDNRTRHEHRMMHGQRRNVDEPFVVDGIKILYPAEGGPGSSDIPQYLIWNCRCTLLSWVKGFEGDTVKSSPGMGDMSFEEWQQAKAPMSAPTNVASQATTPVDFSSTKGLTDSFRQGMAAALSKASKDEAKALYAKYADQLVCVNPNLNRGAFFRASDNGVHMNLANVAAGSNYEEPYEVAFHEFGHQIDFLAGGSNPLTYMSQQSFGGQSLIDTIKSDFRAFKKSLGVSKAADVIPILKAENMDLKTCGNLSDILEKCTGVSYPLGIGHGAKYHKTDGKTEREFFAEVLDSAVTNPNSYAQLERVFPKAVEMVWKMVGGLI